MLKLRNSGKAQEAAYIPHGVSWVSSTEAERPKLAPCICLGSWFWFILHVASLSSRVALQKAKTEATKASSGLVSDIKQHHFCDILFVKASH